MCIYVYAWKTLVATLPSNTSILWGGQQQNLKNVIENGSIIQNYVCIIHQTTTNNDPYTIKMFQFIS